MTDWPAIGRWLWQAVQAALVPVLPLIIVVQLELMHRTLINIHRAFWRQNSRGNA